MNQGYRSEEISPSDQHTPGNKVVMISPEILHEFGTLFQNVHNSLLTIIPDQDVQTCASSESVADGASDLEMSSTSSLV